MSKLMSVLGIVLLAIGLALTLVGLVNPNALPATLQLQGFFQSAVTMLVGGVLAIGLGAVIASLQSLQGYSALPEPAMPEEPEPAPAEAPAPVREMSLPPKLVVPPPPPPSAEPPKFEPPSEPKEESSLASRLRFPGFTRRTAETVGVGAASGAAAGSDLTPSVQQTIDALEQAKADLNKAIGGVSVPPPPPVFKPLQSSPSSTGSMPPPAPEPESKAEVPLEPASDEPAAESNESDLYVVEDKVIRGRPARILSDGTVEAETDEGWMRFENLEHLNEYLDATQPE